MWDSELEQRVAKLDKKMAKVKAALAEVDRERKHKWTGPKEWWHLTDLLEELLDDLYALMLRKEKLRDA